MIHDSNNLRPGDLDVDATVSATVHQAAVDEIRQLRDAHRHESNRAVSAEDELAEFKKQVSELLVSIAENNLGHDVEDHIEGWHNELGLEPPTPEPVTVEYTITVTAKVTPASREVAKTLESVDPSIMLEDALDGLDSLDFDPDTFEVDPFSGLTVEIDHVEVSD